MNILNMLPCLHQWPHHQIVAMLFKGFYSGFWLPVFTGSGCVPYANLSSVVETKILEEINDGRVAGPFTSPPFPNFRVSPLVLVPKKDHHSFCLIHHLSYPEGLSLNDYIDPLLCTVSYSSFADPY